MDRKTNVGKRQFWKKKKGWEIKEMISWDMILRLKLANGKKENKGIIVIDNNLEFGGSNIK